MFAKYNFLPKSNVKQQCPNPCSMSPFEVLLCQCQMLNLLFETVFNQGVLFCRFAVCAQNANDEDIVYAWNVISEMASEVIQACDR